MFSFEIHESKLFVHAKIYVKTNTDMQQQFFLSFNDTQITRGMSMKAVQFIFYARCLGFYTIRGLGLIIRS